MSPYHLPLCVAAMPALFTENLFQLHGGYDSHVPMWIIRIKMADAHAIACEAAAVYASSDAAMVASDLAHLLSALSSQTIER